MPHRKKLIHNLTILIWLHEAIKEKREGEKNLRCNIKPNALVDRALMNVKSITQCEVGGN